MREKEREVGKSQFPKCVELASLLKNTLCSFQRLVPPDVLTQRHLAITLFALEPCPFPHSRPRFCASRSGQLMPLHLEHLPEKEEKEKREKCTCP